MAAAYGGPEVLAVQDVDVPEPADGQVLIDVRAAGANPVDYKLYSGEMGRDPAKLPMPIGLEAAGVVVAFGIASLMIHVSAKAWERRRSLCRRPTEKSNFRNRSGLRTD